MLQDTDLFDKLVGLSNVGGDVQPELTWEEFVSPDERYTVVIVWRFRGDRVGEAYYVIEPLIGTDEFRLYWINLAFIEEWQDKGLLTTLARNYRMLTKYGITSIATTPMDKEAERRLASVGFAWVGSEFVLDLHPSQSL